ncbi:UDP-glucose/GDP-mannose dehydrogenase family protein [candidate division WWE3 bacterium]|uniref:UDP-glucose 6-dehydrogenase n=1 Tax=candidate division WWE3 bacterium TaxID=2053526 RepID=A0A7X9HHV6_UNCKA|nr:UDP-glucose/GDP-mannose dehydrogenase family protein [candidate division WWE3 bacterium]
MKLCVIGTGYVGLVGAAIFSDWGNTVFGVDIDEEKIKRIKAGEMPIYEPGLSEIVLKNISEGRLSFTTSIAEGIKEAEIVFICVGTPQSETGAADLSAVWTVAKEIGQNLNGYKVIVTKSTVPVGTNEKVKQIITENLASPVEFDVASNPEFLREGSSVEDMQNTDRTVIGSDSPKALEILTSLYTHLGSPIVATNLRSAEMIKYAANAFLATKITFINEMAQVCEKAGADVTMVAKGMGLDKRIGSAFLRAGIGYGGSCFPKDVSALYRTATDHSYDFKLLRSVIEVNYGQKDLFMFKATRFLGTNLNGKTLAILGLAFKDNTDDIRDSVAVEIVKKLRGLGAQLKVYDPAASDNARKILGDTSITYCSNEYETMEGADALFVLTEWKQFAVLDLAKIKSLLKQPVIFDGRNSFDKDTTEAQGFTYFAIGKRTNGLEKINGAGNNYSATLIKNGSH